jgi:hemolysin activation/secretion protein
LTTDFSFYQSTGGSLNTTFAIRVGGAVNLGDYRFYQANDLGGKRNLRGHRRMRFSGDHTLFANLEARMRLFRFNMPLFPGSFGIYGFVDTGRVWYKDFNGNDPSTETGKSTLWHTGYGGGIWIAPLRRYVFSIDVSNSTWDKQMLIFLRHGFFF